MSSSELDSTDRIGELRRRIKEKAGLRAFYESSYNRYKVCLSRCPPEGIALELGSGGGFAKERIPQLVTSDFLAYPGIDRVVDATHLPFDNGSLRAILMLNTFHHIPDVSAFFAEASRCLVPNGRVLIIDHHSGWLSSLILRYAHHEPFHPDARDWAFQSTGPLSGANTALAGIVFRRDAARFSECFPELLVERFEPHSPFYYWLAGGLKRWSLIPAWKPAVLATMQLDSLVLKLAGSCMASFVNIELRK
jgi:SAM-dependent methyltransferase